MNKQTSELMIFESGLKIDERVKRTLLSLNTRCDDGSLFSGSHINSFEASYLLDINDIKRRALKVYADFLLKTRRGNSFIAEIYFVCYEYKFMRKTCQWYYFWTTAS